MAVTKERRDAFRFFLEHAGWATPPGRAACALESARDEERLTAAIDAGRAEVLWDMDDLTPEDLSCDAFDADELRAKLESNEWTGPFNCVVKVDGQPVASLG